MTPEYRRVVITAARMAVGQVAPVLPEAALQRGLAARGQRVGAHADDLTTVRADLAGIVEEIDALKPVSCKLGIRRSGEVPDDEVNPQIVNGNRILTLWRQGGF